MVAPSKSNASVFEFDGSRQPSPLLSSSQDDGCSFPCESIEHGKEHPSSCYDDSSGEGWLLLSNSTTEALDLLGATIYFIGCCLKDLEHTVLESCNMYIFNMNKLIQKTPVEINKQPSPKEKRKSLLHTIRGGWYVNRLGQKLPLNKRRVRKKTQMRRVK